MNTVFLIMILFIVLLLGILGIMRIRRDKNLDLTMAYQEQESLDNAGEFQRAQPFAAELCVTAENVGLEGVSMVNDEKSCLLDIDNSEVMFAQGIHEKAYPASITKIITAILAIKYGDMDDVVTISQNAVTLEEGSTMCGFQPGDMVTMDELFHGLLVYSGNDAAMAIAEHLGGSVEHFVEMMNEEARALGATNTHFVNPTGLHDDDHYTTAYDIYLMLNEARTYREFLQISQMSTYTVNFEHADGSAAALSFASTDHYLTGEATPPKDVTILGGKTGTTSDAGNCLALLTQNAYGQPYISIVMNAATKELLYEQMNLLLQQINI